MASRQQGLEEIETALLDAVLGDRASDVPGLTQLRDRVIRELAPTLDRDGLVALFEADVAFRARVAAVRERVGGDIDALRTGRVAARAYAEAATA